MLLDWKPKAMNKRPIEQAQDADLRLSFTALQRAAFRARELAQATGTLLMVSPQGVVELIEPREAPLEIVRDALTLRVGKP
jgi:hypothetical protein